MLPETEPEGAFKVAEAIRNNVSSMCIPHEKSSNEHQSLTLSIGVATLIPGHNTSVAEPISRADKALYFAKKDGRNKIKVDGVKQPNENNEKSKPEKPADKKNRT